MSNDSYLDKLQLQIARIDDDMVRAQRHIDEGAPADQVAAAGELALLRDRRRELGAKLEHAKAHGAKDWSSFRGEIETDVESLGTALENLLRDN